MGQNAPKLDLRRDIGFLLHGTAEPEAPASFDYLQKIAVDLDKPQSFASYEEFAAALDAPLLDYSWKPDGSWSLYSASATLLSRARAFFDGVQDVFEAGGDVFYDMKEGSWGFGGSGDMVVDYWKSGTALYDSLADYPIEGAFAFPASAFVAFSGSARGSRLDVPFERLGDFSRDEKQSLLQLVSDENLPRAAVETALDRYGAISPRAAIDALKFGYDGFLDGIPAADMTKIVRASYERGDLREVCDGKYADYVAPKGKLHDKYVAHKKFAKEYLKSAQTSAGEKFRHVTADAVIRTIMIESTGIRTKIDDSKCFFGLMQISRTVFRDFRDPAYPDDIMDYRANMAAGMRYLEWCFLHYNTPRSPAVASGNYNWGIDPMSDYRTMKPSKSLAEIRPVTFDYLAQHLLLLRKMA